MRISWFGYDDKFVFLNFPFQVCNVLTTVCKKEGLLLPLELAKQISEKSGRNLRKALLMCEACRVQQ